MKKFLAIVFSIISLLCVLNFASCKQDSFVVKETDTYIVITASNDQLEITSSTTLLDYMADLKDDGLLDFNVSGGMITSINGVDNPADWSSCWMVYTDDLEYSSLAFGSIEYQGKTYQSAVLGAETLPIKNGAKYIWIFKAF